jgi:uncharacterized damage-inducible protein DinB
MDDDLRFPIGPFVAPAAVTAEERARLICELRDTPARLHDAITGLSEQRLDTPYRPGGWTVRQVVHHVPDSHMNAYTRFRLALTEDRPTIKPYDEARWAELADARSGPVEVSLDLLTALHARWVALVESLRAEQWTRAYHHPDMGVVSLGTALALYAWHGRHHVAHVTRLRERSGWRS